MKEITQLKEVSFRFQRIDDVTLGGINLSALNTGRASPLQMLQLGSSIQRGELPLAFDVVLSAYNPPEHATNARMVAMDWRVYLENKPLASGQWEREVVIAPGDTAEIALPVQVNLVDIVQNNLQDAIELALSLAGKTEAPKQVKVEILPRFQTPLGTIQYPEPIVLFNREVG